MKRNWKKIVGIIALVAVIAIVAFRLMSNKSITESKVYTYDKNQVIQVGTMVISEAKLQNENTYSGTFEPNKETKISAETQGKINRILVDEGSIVSKGSTLIQLDNSLLQVKVQAVDAQIKQLEVDVNRFQILAEADAIQGVQLEKAMLALKSAKIERSGLLEQIRKTTIRAPFSGVVTQKFTEIGAFAAPGMPLLQITDIHQLKFTIHVSDKELPLFSMGENFQIIPDAYPEIVLNGKTSLIGSKANMGSSFTIQFLAKNTANLAVKSGMYGKASRGETSASSEKGISIPINAIIGTENQSQVYVVKNGKVQLRNITIAKHIKDVAVISEGLAPNEVIVTRRLINLFDGANVSSQK